MLTVAHSRSAKYSRYDAPIHLRLPEEALVKTRSLAEQEGRTATNFARYLFLRALAQYEAGDSHRAAFPAA